MSDQDVDRGPMLTVELEPERRAIHVSQAINSPQVILHAYQPTQFMLAAEARELAAALISAAAWQEANGPVEIPLR